MYDGIEYRGFGQEIVEELAKYAGVPVWNGLTNEYHPTQMLADLLTIREHFGKLKGIKLVYMGDARYNMGNSLMIACAKMGMHFVACTTAKYFPSQELVEVCRGYAAESGATITLTEDAMGGTKDADVIYTDVWVSMGEPDKVWEERIKELSPYKVTKEIMGNAGEGAIFLHCLPAFHDLKTRSEKKWEKGSASQIWKLRMKYSSPCSPKYLTRQKIECIPSRQLWLRLWENFKNIQKTEGKGVRPLCKGG